MNIVLVGYRGCGKTTAGRCAAQRLGWPFVDTDTSIEQRAGLTIREIYARQGEQPFRDLESEILAAIIQRDRQVLSTGGGILLREQNAHALKNAGKIIWLTAPADVLWQRITSDPMRKSHRPVLDPVTGLEPFRQALTQREPLYARWADAVIETDHCTPESVAEQILAAVGLNTEQP